MFTQFETDAMYFILAGDHPVLAELKKQFQASSFAGRECDGYGSFLHFNVPVGFPKLTDRFAIRPGFTITDAQLRIGPEYHLYGMALFVEDGYISMLDGYPLGDHNWPESIGDYRFVYSTDAERDMIRLEGFWMITE